ncbi:DUF445 domain-containing protein [Sandaracinobacteroides saxicola]|uniref:DUF445 domain-containing protein n=1 Tax=Sandaracinobacteroides saxicola TaxID=2759707 RepID=UPI001FB1218A|nr:DUF445 domain-containing protein [Sandaracinobacteroides saxicola]
MGDNAARLKAVAGGLLLLSASLLIAATLLMRAGYPQFVWLQAFAEAALVGGLADWFAVTALFRRPMGLPIPHTAIIPANKDRIGDALALFVRDNFLTPGNVARRLERFDAADTLAGWLERPASGARARRGLGSLLEMLASGPAADEVGRRIREAGARKLRETPVAPLLGRMLEAMVANGRHLPVLEAAIGWARNTLDNQEGLIRAMVEDRTAWLLRLVNVDEKVADAIVDGLRALLAEVQMDPHHPIREKAERAIADLIFDLKHMPEMQAKVERVKRELLDSPAVGEWLEGLWGEAKAGLKGLLAGDAPGAIGASVAKSLRGEAALAAAVNALARRAIVGTVARYGDSIVGLISDTVRGWDAATITDKLESAVSRDLQFIRLNGTLIGGLIGVALHAVLMLA